VRSTGRNPWYPPCFLLLPFPVEEEVLTFGERDGDRDRKRDREIVGREGERETERQREKDSSWKIQGLRFSAFGLKSSNPDYIKEIGNTYIVILQETWYRENESTGCPSGYRELVVPSTVLPGVQPLRESGDMLIWYRADLTNTLY
jgi:hypothetical protein